MPVATKIKKPLTVAFPKDSKLAVRYPKFDVTGDWNAFSSIEDATTSAGSADNLLEFINNKAEAVVKARANSVWRPLGEDTTETVETITAKMLDQLLSNPFVSERGTAAIREDAKRMNDVKNMKARYAAGEITLDELLASI